MVGVVVVVVVVVVVMLVMVVVVVVVAVYPAEWGQDVVRGVGGKGPEGGAGDGLGGR